MKTIEDLYSIDIDIDRVLDMTQLTPMKTRNIYVYGSQVYRTDRPDSDTDILVTACTMNVHKEYNDGEYNIHVITPDIFADRLRMHDMQQLECIYSPNCARIQEDVDYLDGFELNRDRLKKKVLSQSTHSWHQAKIRMRDGDIERGAKSLFHSLRMLVFAEQILEEGEIFDFSEANYWFEQITEDDAYEWKDYKAKWLPKKKFLESLIKKL